jgi:hypothetical protein
METKMATAQGLICGNKPTLYNKFVSFVINLFKLISGLNNIK